MADRPHLPDSAPVPRAAGSDAASLPSGYRLNDYVIERTLGAGGFGITYLARDVHLDLPVAIKEYFPADLVGRGPAHALQVHPGNEDHPASYAWGLERFLDEARALAAFRHPNIVRVLRYFQANETAYIVMEYESGLPLKHWVPQNTPLTQRLLLSIVYPLLDGLESVHSLGFLHRDIKPDNIYVRADGTPVLLDFGAARRVSAQRDLTNIVSPGFAPFEQYHSEGHQGPWTDLYALGAVLYWMTTGKKPVEAAARVKNDTMLPASSVAQVGVFGSALLAAIEWAMQPDEARRPQSVQAFRTAIVGSERAELAGPAADAAPVHAGGPGSSPSVPATGRPTVNAAAAQRRNLLGTVMFLDVVGHAARAPGHEATVKKLLAELVGKALRGVAEDSRIAIDTGDGLAICFLGDPEEALHSALLLRDLMVQRYGRQISPRIGLHMGPVRVVADINDRVNVVGDGINVAQRIMDFAQGGQVLVSRACYDVISRLTDDPSHLFQYLGQHEDRHGRRHEVYAAEAARAGQGPAQREVASTGYTRTLPVKSSRPLDPAAVGEIEAELARHIGPLARVLVRKAHPLAPHLHGLREALAPSIQDARAREAFLAGPPSQSHAVSRARSGASARERAAGSASRTSPASAAREGTSTSVRRPVTQPLGPSASVGSWSGRPGDVTADELAVIEHHLSRYIGPMARVLLRKETERGPGLLQLVEAAAENIDLDEQRQAFVQAVRKALPRRG